jgi:hypothetical protein
MQVVQQRPPVQIRRLPGLPLGLQEGGAAHRKQRFLEQRLGVQRVGDPVGEGDPDVEVPPVRVDLAVVGLELDATGGASTSG